MSQSPLPAMDSHQEICDKLDEDIARVRAEIQTLTKRRNLLSASLLSSSKVQSALRPPTLNTTTSNQSYVDRNPLLLSQLKHNQSNIYRLAFGVTAFPFHDPSPEIATNPLIGIRFDISSRTGKYNRAPYYIFCKKNIPSNPSATATTTLSIHHHTIPASIPLQDYEAKYLPQDRAALQATVADEGYYGSTSSTSPTAQNQTTAKQNLHALVTAVRSDLSSWIQRQEAIDYLSEILEVADNSVDDLRKQDVQAGKFGVSSLGATGVDARFIRIVWTDGRVGRLKLSDEGYISKAAVFGDVQLRDVERMLSIGTDGSPLNVIDLVDRLGDVENHARTSQTVQQDGIELGSETNGDVEMDGS